MPRPCTTRRCRFLEGERGFRPHRTPRFDPSAIRLELGELEAMCLCDLEGYDQEAAGSRMGISRGTVQRLLQAGRTKVLTALLESSALIVEKGEHDEANHSGREWAGSEGGATRRFRRQAISDVDQRRG